MTALLEHFHEAVTTPEDVEKLKKLILQLAMQGKLVEQNPNDESAVELLKRVEEEKESLIKEKIIKKPKPLPRIGEDEVPYELPIGWEWVRLYDICYNHGQKKPDRQFSYIDVASIDNKNGRLSDEISVLSPDEAPSRARKIVKEGTVIYSTVRPYLLNIAIIDKEFENEPIVSTAFAILHPFEGISNKFLYHYLRSNIFIEYVESKMIGVAYPAINDNRFFSGLLPLPPIKEQVRIVNEIEKLFKQCELLSTELVKKQTASAVLNKSVFTRLQDHTNVEQMKELRFVIEHIEHLCNHKESIAQLKNSILSLAVQGKLVEQDVNEEPPASVLIAKIKQEKERLVDEKKIKKEKTLPSISDDEIPYELPKGWEWFRLSEITTKITDGTHHSPPNGQNGDYIYITAKNIKIEGVKLSNVTYVEEKVHHEIYSRCNPEYGDVLYIKDGATTGLATINNLTEPFSMLSSVALLKTTGEINNRYFAYWLNSPIARDMYLSKVSGSAITRLTLTKIKNFIIPIPPLQEQNRIVDFLDILMEMCYKLEEKVQETDTKRKSILVSTI